MPRGMSPVEHHRIRGSVVELFIISMMFWVILGSRSVARHKLVHVHRAMLQLKHASLSAYSRPTRSPDGRGHWGEVVVRCCCRAVVHGEEALRTRKPSGLRPGRNPEQSTSKLALEMKKAAMVAGVAVSPVNTIGQEHSISDTYQVRLTRLTCSLKSYQENVSTYFDSSYACPETPPTS